MFDKFYKTIIEEQKKIIEKYEAAFNRVQKDTVVEFETGYVIAGYAAEGLTIIQEMPGENGAKTQRNGIAWFRKGKTPKCDYLKQSIDGVISFYNKQSDLEVSREGTVKVVKTVSKKSK